ncbi:sulfotransferase family 2 domain-containing protein [Aestuariicoccus sp. MJ-SS9]|uniref:sulfotransferase family 2 domain-containing protein n=1 Tax=Aestuariicoccus sp. MJ-SS9 TaxID=3079855 RepID=UPI0029071EA1|nr:sulfotransferase family 2 domain-containing protein [Aestuariicoccus sp. MJ-SS9]MDU8912155.1 sulfotransferase family 2 domain-containing protein [Aestuariicoccus sp. MJ-SS9]
MDMGWRGYIDKIHGCVFFWSQKAACTTLFGFLADNMTPAPAHKKYFHTQSLPYHHCLPAIKRQRLQSAILVRHPVTRIISAYFNKFCLYQGRVLRTRDDLEPFARDLHDLYGQITGAPRQANVMTFEGFLDAVAHLHANRDKPRHPVNGHWETQVPPFLVAEGLRYDHIVHVERLDAEMTALARALGMRWTPRAMNRTERGEGPLHPGYLGDVPARDVAGYAFSYDNFITDATLAKIHALYATDFEMFGYPLRP